jgi:hypothetical protein
VDIVGQYKKSFGTWTREAELYWRRKGVWTSLVAWRIVDTEKADSIRRVKDEPTIEIIRSHHSHSLTRAGHAGDVFQVAHRHNALNSILETLCTNTESMSNQASGINAYAVEYTRNEDKGLNTRIQGCWSWRWRIKPVEQADNCCATCGQLQCPGQKLRWKGGYFGSLETCTAIAGLDTPTCSIRI